MQLFNQPTLLTADKYASDVVKKIRSARKRILIVATVLRDDDPNSHAIVEALCEASDRGVETIVYIDTFTYLEPKGFALRSSKRQPARTIQAMKLERRLKQHGITFHWLGRKTIGLLVGRTHSKWTVIDDVVYTFGGVNLDHSSFTNVDYIFRLKNALLADVIAKEQEHIYSLDCSGGAARSHSYAISDQSITLFDGGLIGDSIIYRRACDLAQKADKIILVSQYCPTGRLAHILKKKPSILYFNHWRHASSLNRFLITLGMFTAKHDTSYTRDAYLHAKFIIFTMPDGQKVAITGSHNFMFGSGAMGTREIALETTDHHIIRQLESFLHQHVV